jgi:ABC-type transporter Mla subunit MlaD
MTDDVFRWVIAIGVALAAIAFLIQAGIAVALYRIARRMQAKVTPLAERAEPILDTTRQMLAENRPRVAEISTHAVEVAKSVRRQTTQIGELLDETSTRARIRLADLDEKVEETVEQVGQVGGAVKTVVMKPVREMNAIMAGVRAALVTYARGRRPSVDHVTQDEEMFI